MHPFGSPYNEDDNKLFWVPSMFVAFIVALPDDIR